MQYASAREVHAETATCSCPHTQLKVKLTLMLSTVVHKVSVMGEAVSLTPCQLTRRPCTRSTWQKTPEWIHE